MPVSDCKIINLPLIDDIRGNLTFIESNKHIDFEIKRVYYLYNVPKNQLRAGHAHKKLNQIIICLTGAVEILIDDGDRKEIIILSDPAKGLLLKPRVWREINFIEENSICLCLADQFYEESDYLRKYDDFKNFVLKIND